MMIIKLREAMLAHGRRIQQRVTYKLVAKWTGISEYTLRSIGGRPGYGTTMANLEKICIALDVTPGDLLEIIPDKPRKSKKKKKKRSRKKVTKRR